MPALAALLLALCLATHRMDAQMNHDDMFPPWQATAGETPATDRKAFADCEAAIEGFAAQTKGQVSARTYTESPRWGRILRARITAVFAGEPDAVLMTCWTDPRGGVEVATRVNAAPW
jgi:hypothetical protein